MEGSEGKLDTREAVEAWVQAQQPQWSVRSCYYRFDLDPDDEYNWWVLREYMREQRRQVPIWVSQVLDPNNLYFVHCSRQDPLQIAFTPSPDDGVRDRQVVTTPGRFLTKYAPKLNEKQIRQYADMHRAQHSPPTVWFCFDADMFEHIYRHGPSSCMGNKDLWPKGKHPARAYDGPDVVMAFLMDTDELMINSRITARCLINLAGAGFTFSRIYGDEQLMRSRLQAFGFDHVWGIPNARLQRIKSDQTASALLLPYIDGAPGAVVGKEWIEVRAATSDDIRANAQSVGAQNTAGYVQVHIPTEDGQFCCPSCDDNFDDAQGTRTFHNQLVCGDCLEEFWYEVIVNADGTRGWVHGDDCITMEESRDGKHGVDMYLQDNGLLTAVGIVWSNYHDMFMWRDECVEIDTPNTGGWIRKELVCQPVGYNHAFTKDECFVDWGGRWVWNEDARSVMYLAGNGSMQTLRFHPGYPPPFLIEDKESNKWRFKDKTNLLPKGFLPYQYAPIEESQLSDFTVSEEAEPEDL